MTGVEPRWPDRPPRLLSLLLQHHWLSIALAVGPEAIFPELLPHPIILSFASSKFPHAKQPVPPQADHHD
jgi:hypothetical protein